MSVSDDTLPGTLPAPVVPEAVSCAGHSGLPDDDGASLALAQYAQRAYLEYAVSVVKGRALPDVTDGMKPVQRRILYAMARMGLSHGSSGGAASIPRPVKSARVVGDVLGRFHPHGDQSAYEALVRMAQDFSQRYPLVDGQGNFGSRDGDAAAAMRYTEARLAPIARLLLEEIDAGTADFRPNYDGSTEEPVRLPARLPFALLNGASGIAVGLATEIPSHNLAEVAKACVALLHNPALTDDELFALIPGPDYPGGGHIISSSADIAAAYRSGRGSLKVRGRWVVEELARGQWQLVVQELPPGVSAQRVLQEIEDITNPRVKPGKKTLTQEQQQMKAAMLAVLETVRDESGKDAPVRLVFEPRSGKTPQADLIHALLAYTSLQTSVSINLTLIAHDGTPLQLSLREMLAQWLDFRSQTVTRRSEHRLERVQQRIHILQGRQTALAHLDEVIALIRDSDAPREELMQRFGLSAVQADDILDIRLRQLARLEAVRIAKEMADLQNEARQLREVLESPSALGRLMAEEIRADAATYGDARRTLIQSERPVTAAAVPVPDEAVTVILSVKGWARTHKGHGHPSEHFSFKPGDQLMSTFECRSVDTLILFGSNGRVYSLPVSSLPGGRGDGQPLTSLVELEAGTHIAACHAGAAHDTLLLAGSGGYGLLAQVQHLLARNRSGKAFLTLHAGETLCPPSLVPPEVAAQLMPPSGPLPAAQQDAAMNASSPTCRVACLSARGQLLCLPLHDLRLSPGGGRGLQLIKLADDDHLLAVPVWRSEVRIQGLGRGGAVREEVLSARILGHAEGKRGSRGKPGGWTMRLQSARGV